MKIQNIVLMALASMMPLAATADNPKVKDFKVSGVHLGMGAEEAINAIAEYYSVDSGDFRVARFPDAIPTTGFVGAVDFAEFFGQDLRIDMYFAPDLDRESDGYMVLSELEIDHEKTGFGETVDRMVKEYGPESVILKETDDRINWHHLWCAKVIKNGTRCSRDEAGLIMSSGKTSLRTNAYEIKYKEQLDEHRQRNQ